MFGIFSQQAKLFEERMSNVFGGVEGAPSGEQINMTFQKMAGMAFHQKKDSILYYTICICYD